MLVKSPLYKKYTVGGPFTLKKKCMITLCQMVSNAEDSNMSTDMVADLEQKLRNVQVGLSLFVTHIATNMIMPLIQPFSPIHSKR